MPTTTPRALALLALAISANTYTAAQTQTPLPQSPKGTWNRETVSKLLGPSFDELNPNAKEDRPTHFSRKSKPCPALSFFNRTDPFELGEQCIPDDDYWSESGQVAYVPDDPQNDPGLDRVQVFAYYNRVFALSPRLDFASGKPHPDPQTTEANYAELLGHPPGQPIAMVRNYGMLQNEALVLYRGGLLAVAGTQTSRSPAERPYPGLLFPANKVPTAIAVTTMNEFALITVTDTNTGRGQLAVVALEGKYLPFHTWPYMALANQGSFSAFKLLGYVDLPMAKPTAVATATNGWWNGPSQTNSQVLSQIDLTNDGTRAGIYKGAGPGWESLVANKGYAVIAAHDEDKAVFVDLGPLLNYVRDSYFASPEKFKATMSGRGEAPNAWPMAFSENTAAAPKVVSEFKVQKPTAVLAGMQINRWLGDHYKAYVASEDGTIHVFDASTLMARWDWEGTAPLAELGSFKVGRNPVCMIFNRFGDSPLPLMPKQADGSTASEPLNNTFHIVCRGDREIVTVVVWGGNGQVYRRIKDTRLADPVAASVAGRGNILTVADYAGRKIVSFRIGGMVGRQGQVYPVGGDGTYDFEYAGELPVAGHPFAVNSANVN
ncbi:MAG: hypothetical protein QM790_07845 [Nibricoccus sp.]